MNSLVSVPGPAAGTVGELAEAVGLGATVLTGGLSGRRRASTKDFTGANNRTKARESASCAGPLADAFSPKSSPWSTSRRSGGAPAAPYIHRCEDELAAVDHTRAVDQGVTGELRVDRAQARAPQHQIANRRKPWSSWLSLIYTSRTARRSPR